MAKRLPKSVFIGIFATVLISGILIAGAAEQSTAAKKMNIPGWIKNNAGWWANNQITDEDFVLGIEFLIKEGAMEVPSAQASEQGMTDGQPFDELWDAIIKLQNDLTSIETGVGIPGPQGEQGPQGQQGLAGPQGEQGPPGSGGSTDLSALQAQIDELETQLESLQNPSIEVRRIQTTKLIPVGPGTTLVQTPECNSDEFVHSFGYSQNIAGQSLGTNAQPPDTVILTPTKLAVRVGNTLDEPYNLNLDLWCAKIIS